MMMVVCQCCKGVFTHLALLGTITRGWPSTNNTTDGWCPPALVPALVRPRASSSGRGWWSGGGWSGVTCRSPAQPQMTLNSLVRPRHQAPSIPQYLQYLQKLQYHVQHTTFIIKLYNQYQKINEKLRLEKRKKIIFKNMLKITRKYNDLLQWFSVILFDDNIMSL